MKSFTRRLLVRRGAAFAGAAAMALLHAALAAAEAPYPKARPIVIVVPFAPGGSVDSVARMLAQRFASDLGQNVIVENRPGASGTIGAASVARAEPDGYTLYFNASIHSINPLLFKSTIKFDAVKDFTAIGMVAQGDLIFSVNSQVPAKTVQELIGAVKAAPNKYNFATSGYGSAGHLGLAQFLYATGLSKDGGMPIVVYKGAAPALQDLVGGQVQAMMDPFLSSLPHVKAGKLRALAVSGAERSPLLPDVPTLREAGLPGFEFYSWYGLWAPAKLPAPIVKTLEAAVAKAAQDPAFKTMLNGMGFEVSYRSAASFDKFIASEMVKYQAIIERANIKIE